MTPCPKPTKQIKERKPLRASRWGVSRKVSKSRDARSGGMAQDASASVDRRKGKRAGAQLRGGVRPTGVLSASGASPAFPKPGKKEGTKHSRRPREWGFMAFCHKRGCELRLDAETLALAGIHHVCDGPIEFSHLSDLKRYDVGDIGAGLCRDAGHRAIDGRIGGKAPWYVELGIVGQRRLRMRLSSRARAAWDALPAEVREAWDRMATPARRRAA